MIDHLLQLSIHCFYVGEVETGLRACERLLRMELTREQEALVRSNRTWYTPSLESLLPCRFQRIEVPPAAPGWSLFNPSILARDGGWWVNVRSSNYRIEHGRYVMQPVEETCIRTENVLLELGEDFTVRRTRRLDWDYEKTDYPVDGLEDLRLNEIEGRIVGSACVRNFSPLDGTCRIGTAAIDGGSLVDVEVLPTRDGAHEKNWMPILGRRLWLYAASAQGRVSTVREDDGRWRVEGRGAAPILARGFRGGSQLVPVGDGRWLALIHEVALSGEARVYEHRFVLFDETRDFAIVGVSPIFYFRRARGIEFAAGLARHGDRLVASFGVHDAEAWLVELSLEALLTRMVSPE
jgi:hypothetical protein